MATPKLSPVQHEQATALHLKRPIAVIDLETTGTFPEIDQIIEIGIFKIMPDGERTRFFQRIKPGIEIPVDASAVHGIKNRDVAHQPTFKAVAKRILKAIRGCDLVGYNISGFDLPMLCAEFERAGMDLPLDDVRVIDVKDIYHHHEGRGLCDAVKFYCNLNHEDKAHSAFADARATWEVLQAQVHRHGLPRSVGKLAEMLEEWRESRERKYADSGNWFVRRGKKHFFARPPKKIGMPVARVAREDPGFLDWMLRLEDLPNDTRAIVERALRRRQSARM